MGHTRFSSSSIASSITRRAKMPQWVPIANVESGLCVALSSPMGHLHLENEDPCKDEQLWDYLEATTKGIFRNKTGLVADIKGSVGPELLAWSHHGGPNQKFAIKDGCFIHNPCNPDPCELDPCTPGTEDCTSPPSGEWTGFYVQSGVKYHFTMTLTFSSDGVQGQCTDGQGNHSLSGAVSDISGSLETSGQQMSIRWVKQYRGRHSVDYAGSFTAGLNRITGTYFNGAGSFEMFCKEPTPDSCKPDPCKPDSCKPDPCNPEPCTFPPSGEWTGFYVHCGVKYHFTMTLTFSSSSNGVNGQCTDGEGNHSLSGAVSDISGSLQISGQQIRIRFVKQYRGRHAVNYAGSFTSGFKRITGTYFNGCNTFQMDFKEPTPDPCQPDPCQPDPCKPDPCDNPDPNDRVWDVEFGRCVPGARIIVWRKHGGANQQFIFKK